MKNFRDEFCIPDNIYLLNHSVGCLPCRTEIATENFLKLWKEKGSHAWDDWLRIIKEFCCSLACLLNGDVDAFCPQTNISSALVKILHSLMPPSYNKNKILLSDLDFPSLGFVISQAEKLGYKLEFIRSQEGIFPLELWESHLTDDVCFALITHVLSENSYKNPVKEITQIAHHCNIITVVDIAQSVGVIPINLEEWSADFVIGSSVKWLCGGPGAAFMWVNLANIENFNPIDVGWFSHENPFEFDIHNYQACKTAYRFLGGTPSVLPFYLAKNSIDLIHQIGINQIYQHNQYLIDLLLQSAIDEGLTINSPKESSQRGGTLVLDFGKNKHVVEYLAKKKIIVDERPKFGVRFSPHIYNTVEEIYEVSTIYHMINKKEFIIPNKDIALV